MGDARCEQAIRGADLSIVSGAIGAGLSSSAAVEIGVARALSAVSHAEWDPRPPRD
jgi:mevalonate kinase